MEIAPEQYLHEISTSPFPVLQADTPDDFVRALSPVYGLGGKHPNRHLLYRGHGRQSWRLIPSARREEAWPLPTATGAGGFPNTWQGRILAEIAGLLGFCTIAESQGLRIPEFLSIRDELFARMGAVAGGHIEAAEKWPPWNATPALALAQHHGLPTCLLDFTLNPYVAAYFAAIDAMDHPNGDEDSLAVWIINDPDLLFNRRFPDQVLHAIVPPPSDNRTLQAQEGLFLFAPLWRGRIHHLKAKYKCDYAFEDLIIGRPPPSKPIKLLLARKHAPMLLHKLIKLGYGGSRLFPTYAGAVRCIREYEWARIGPSL